MRTLSHLLVTAGLGDRLQRRGAPIRLKAFLLGSVLPDLPLVLLTVGYLIANVGLLWRDPALMSEFGSLMDSYHALYFNNPWWIAGHNLFHAPFVIAALFLTGVLAERRGLRWGPALHWLALGLALHSAIDILTHHDDGPLLFFPFDWRYRFPSPVSYWDRAYYGGMFTVFEYGLDLLLVAYFALKGARRHLHLHRPVCAGASVARLQTMMPPWQRAGVIGLTVVLLLPLVPLTIWAFGQRWLFPAALPTEWGLRAWRYILAPGTRVLTAFSNSLVVALVVTLLSIIIAIPAARVLGLAHFRGKTLVEFLILAPTVVPAFAAAMGIQVLFIRYGLADTMAGVILVHMIPVLPYAVLILAGIFANYDVDYEHQARVLGAGSWTVFWRVTLPMILPGIIVAALFAFLISWSQYLLTLLIGGGQVLTLPVLLLAFANSGDYAITAALSLVFVAPAVVALLFSARYLTGGHAALRGV